MRGDTTRANRPVTQRPPADLVRAWERLTRLDGSTLYGGSSPQGRGVLWASAPTGGDPDSWMWYRAGGGQDETERRLPDGWRVWISYNGVHWARPLVKIGPSILRLPWWHQQTAGTDDALPLATLRATIALGALEVRW